MKENNMKFYMVKKEYIHPDEHPFCDANCNKPIRNPIDMRYEEWLFCDEECKANFTGGMPNEPHDIEKLVSKYKFLTWLDKQQGCTFEREELVNDNEFDKDWIHRYFVETTNYVCYFNRVSVYGIKSHT